MTKETYRRVYLGLTVSEDESMTIMARTWQQVAGMALEQRLRVYRVFVLRHKLQVETFNAMVWTFET